MEPVVTINLNGNPYQLDQSAYDALRAYLDAAEATLASNPDKAEILRDLEQAIADKCRAFLSAHKTVVSADEMKHALAEMGPVEGGQQSSEAPGGEQASAQTGGAKKRIYRIRDGAQIAGVCAGIGAYFDIDAHIIRLLFIVLALITSGGFLLVYLVLMFVIPSAHTSEEWAAAHGVPFNAQEVIDQAKRQYSDFAQNGGPPWWGPRSWRNQQRRAFKRDMRDRARAYAQSWNFAPAPPPSGPVSYTASILAGVVAMVFGLIRFVLLIAFLACLISLLTTNAIGYYHVPANIETWQAVMVLVIIYAVISIPLRALRWGALAGGPYYAHRGAEGLGSLALILVGAWLAYHYVPEAHAWMDRALQIANHMLADLSRDLGN